MTVFNTTTIPLKQGHTTCFKRGDKNLLSYWYVFSYHYFIYLSKFLFHSYLSKFLYHYFIYLSGNTGILDFTFLN
jgi:hypothetical protein